MSVIGSYPCCNGDLWISLPAGPLPKYMPEDCPHCGAKVWHKLARLDPTSWTEADFLKEFVVDPVEKTIVPKDPPPASSPLDMLVIEEVARLMADKLVDELLNGSADVKPARLT